jgi:hypothetical protein
MGREGKKKDFVEVGWGQGSSRYIFHISSAKPLI